MKPLLLIILFLISFKSHAFAIRTTVHSVHLGEKSEPHLVFLSSGEVAFLRGPNKAMSESFQVASDKKDILEINLDKNHNLISVQQLPQARDAENSVPSDQDELMSYAPSIISTTTASSTFTKMRRDYQLQSQCYNRAHIWTYEEYKRSGLRSNKLFLFFTTRYIRAYNYFWWFHVTPMVYVGGTTSAFWKTLDRRYTRSPLSLRTWTNIFMYNDANCPIVYRWSDYYNHQSTQYCYLIPKSMYFWQPRDIVTEENSGYVKTQYISSQINYAYWEAF